MNNQENINTEMGKLKQNVDSLADEAIDSPSGNSVQLVHHLNGESSNKLIVGTSGKGKSFLKNRT